MYSLYEKIKLTYLWYYNMQELTSPASIHTFNEPSLLYRARCACVVFA